MKRCPSCHRVFTDPAQKFCLNDGNALVEQAPPSSNLAATIMSPGPSSQPGGSSQSGQGSYPGSGAQTGHSQAGWATPTPQAQYSAPEPPKKRSKLPWILGGLVVAVIGLVVVGVVGLMVLGIMVGNSNNENSSVTTNSTVTNSSRRTTATESYNSANANSESTDDDAPTDRDAVLSDLTEVENEWIQANIAGDKAALDRILATEYTGTSSDGVVQSKDQYLETAQPVTNVKNWKMSDEHVSLIGDTAVMTGILDWATTSGKDRYRFTDTFIWRDGRWQAIGSQASPVK
jgi:hypothetical protein